jgi:hypothetical protein
VNIRENISALWFIERKVVYFTINSIHTEGKYGYNMFYASPMMTELHNSHKAGPGKCMLFGLVDCDQQCDWTS